MDGGGPGLCRRIRISSREGFETSGTDVLHASLSILDHHQPIGDEDPTNRQLASQWLLRTMPRDGRPSEEQDK
jgi:hypothetical protein